MKVLFMHASCFDVNVVSPAQSVGEYFAPKVSETEHMENCVVAFINIEQGDRWTDFDCVIKAIKKMSVKWDTKNLMLSGFAHLSTRGAIPSVALDWLKKIVTHFLEQGEYCTQTSHFGYDKSLDLSVFGHPGSFRFWDSRETW